MLANVRQVLVMLALFLVEISIFLGLARVVLISVLVGPLSVMSVSAHFDCTFTELCEVMGDRPTRRGFVDGALSVVSRIDRVFMNLLPGELLSRGAGVCVLDDLSSADLLSDHSPVLLSFGRVAKRNGGGGGVLRWVADRSDFPDIVCGQFGRSMTCLVEEPFGRLRRYKEAMSKAATMIINRAAADECVSPASRLFWIAAARSAVRARSRLKLARAVDRFPCLSDLSIVMIVLPFWCSHLCV